MSTIEWKRRYRNDFLDRIVNDTAYRIKIGAGIIGATLVIWGLVYMFSYRRTETFAVAHIGWDTQIAVQQYQTVHEGGWSVPSGGRETDSYIKQSGTRRVFDRKVCEDRADGTEVCEDVYKYVPVYDRYYEYDIDRWVSIAPLTAAGSGYEWYLPDITDADYIDQPTLGNKRLGARQAHFFIVFANEQKQVPVDMPEARWKTHKMGEKYDITFGFVGNVLDVKKSDKW